ncbi:hypothetical protein ACJJTC_004230 [Scirpophaga incertulas]
MNECTLKTSFLAGSTFTVHWHLAYAHRGGFSLRILDELERPVLDLTPRAAGSEFVRDDVTAQKYEVRLPSDFTCENCTLQLQREAGEWGSSYRFWSCADIDIVQRAIAFNWLYKAVMRGKGECAMMFVRDEGTEKVFMTGFLGALYGTASEI